MEDSTGNFRCTAADALGLSPLLIVMRMGDRVIGGFKYGNSQAQELLSRPLQLPVLSSQT